MITLLDTLPEGVSLSEDLRKRALCYVPIQLFGRTYYVPLTLHMVRTLGGTRKKGGSIVFNTYKKERDAEEFIQTIAMALYLQVRDTVGSEIHDTLSREIQEQFQNLFSKNLGIQIQSQLDQRMGLLPPPP